LPPFRGLAPATFPPCLALFFPREDAFVLVDKKIVPEWYGPPFEHRDWFHFLIRNGDPVRLALRFCLVLDLISAAVLGVDLVSPLVC